MPLAAAETQGAELTSKLKPTHPGTPSAKGHRCVCVLFIPLCLSVMRTITYLRYRLTDFSWKGGQDVQQHGQDCRGSDDGGTTETGGEHREDDGENRFGWLIMVVCSYINNA